MNYVSFPLKDLGAGIDSLSAENQLGEGYSEDLLNVDPTPEGYLRKRAGYGSVSGWLPLRISSLEANSTGDKLCFYLDSGIDVTSIDLSSLRSSPLIVQGKIVPLPSPDANLDFSASNQVYYYSGFDTDTLFTFATGTHTNTLAGTTHNLGEKLFVGVAASTNSANTSNSVFMPGEAKIVLADDNVEVEYTNGTGQPFDGYIYLLSGADSAGTVYSLTTTLSATSITILASTHQLSNSNIITAFYVQDGTKWVATPLETSIATNGDVTFSYHSSLAGSTALIILRAVDPLQTLTINVPANTVVSTQKAIDTSFLVWAAYEETLSERTQFIPDAVEVDASTGLATVSFTNSTSSPKLVQFYFEYGRVITNKICVTNTTAGITTSTYGDVQLTLWGIPHTEIYSSTLDQHQGWATHIDAYRSAGEERLITGLGGNFFTPSTDESAFLLGSAYPRLRNRLDSTVYIGPAFGGGASRTRGVVNFLGDGEGYARASDINWDSGLGWVKYTLDVPSLSVSGTPISVTSGVEDQLTITQASNSIHNGTFTIKQVTYNVGPDTIEIWVDNSAVDSADFDEQDCGARCGVFTDQLPLTEAGEFLPGDALTADGFTDADAYSVVSLSSDGLTLVIDGVDSPKSLAGALRIAAGRSSSIIPLRDNADDPTSTNFIRGDVIAYTGIARTPQVLYVNALDSTAVTVNALNDVATVTGIATSGFQVGQQVIVSRGSNFTGVQTISEITSATSFGFATTEVDGYTASAVILGHTIEVNEDLAWSDNVGGTNEVLVPSRWAPIESPAPAYTAVPQTYFRHYDANSYINQPVIRSTISNDNMYFTNGSDEVLKYDGSNVYRAGLTRWQPELFLTIDTGAGGGIAVDLPSIPAGSVSNLSGNVFTVSIGQEQKFAAGDALVITESGTIKGQVSVDSVWDNNTSGFVRVVGSIASIGTIGNVALALNGRYRYYFRLNLVDANNNTVASAVSGADDYIANVTATCNIRIRLVGLPIWDNYNFGKIECEIYRTKLGSVAPFYKVVTLDVPFEANNGYIDYTDTNSDDTLSQLDKVSTVTEGAELGIGWSEPLRAKYITTADNRLVLANIKDYPKLTTTFRIVGAPSDASFGTKTVQLHKDSTDSTPGTDNLSRTRFEWKHTGSSAITSITNVSGTTYKVTIAGTYAVGDWVYLLKSNPATTINLSFAGWHQITAVGGGGFEIKASSSSLNNTNGVDALVVATAQTDIPVWLGNDYNYGTDNGNDRLAGAEVTFTALRRLVNAINTTQRVCQTSGFVPWVIASGGSEFGGDTFLLASPKTQDTTLSMTLPSSAISGIEFYVNDSLRTAGDSISARTQVFGSRMVVSYQNYPELFNRPTELSPSTQLVLDINPADGQDITGVIPFFGESSSGAARTNAVVVVFKTTSIYVVDLASTDDNRIQKVDSRGIGCTAPFSIAPTQNGIMFASDSGVFRFQRDLTVKYIGRKIERTWRSLANTSYRENMTGHYYPYLGQYKLSIPNLNNAGQANSDVVVYNTVREYTADGFRDGSWTRYDSHPVVGWANLTSGAFFGSTGGDVAQIYLESAELPFRDSGSAISAEALLRSLDFGDASIRKAVSNVSVSFRTATNSGSDTSLATSIDNKDQFEDSDQANITDEDTPNDGMGSTGQVKVRTIQYSVGRRKGSYFQMKFTNDTLDSGMEIAGVTVRVGGLSDKGTLQAKDT